MAQENQMGESSRQIRLTVRADLLEVEGAKEIPAGAVYVFSTGGRLLAQEGIASGREVVLSISGGETARSVRVLIGPEMAKDQIDPGELLRRGAEERFLRIEPGDIQPSVRIEVIPEKWLCWLRSVCFVRGTLLKRQNVDGVLVDLPVCDATVEVYEVDPLPIIIRRLPDSLIERLRDIVIWDEPPSVGPFPPELGPGPESAVSALISGQQRGLGDAPELRLVARAASTQQLRNLFVDYPRLIRPLLCRYFPWVVTMQKVATGKTDNCGRFQTLFFRGCNNPDTPDLYFKAWQTLFGPINVAIYAPTPIACYTHWNYQCGSEVTLYTSSPFARTCSPCPPVIAGNNWVLAMAIGNLPLSRIRGCSSTLAATTTPQNHGLNLALSDAKTFNGRPFGGLLRLRLEFDNSLREQLGVMYYRVSYRRQGDLDFIFLDGEAHRHYIHEVSGQPVIEGYQLGPKEIGGESALFEIPPALPPKGQWSTPDVVEDHTNARFPSVDLVPPAAHGKYELKVDLFDAAGNRVNIDNVGGQQIQYFVPMNEDLAIPGTINTEDAAGLNLVQDVDGSGKKSFVMTLHVDNNVCEAQIHPPMLNSAPANACGVLAYSQLADPVSLPFKALHPNGFANYSFTVKRGVTLLPALSLTGVADPPGNFAQNTTVGTLLSANCPMAGLSEHLHVNAWATNGWGELSQYDAGDHAGFALAPEMSP